MAQPVRVPFLNPRRLFNICDETDTHPIALVEEVRGLVIACHRSRTRLLEQMRANIPNFDPTRERWLVWFARWQAAADRNGLAALERINNLSPWLPAEGQEVVALKIWMTGFGDTIEQRWAACIEALANQYSEMKV
jgi:hypothetical protein